MLRYGIYLENEELEKFKSIKCEFSAEELEKLNNRELIHILNSDDIAAYGIATKSDDHINIKILSEPDTLLGTEEVLKISNTINDFEPYDRNLTCDVEDLFDYISLTLAIESKKLYRGQADFSWGLLPSVFRTTPPPERDIFSELKQLNHKDFTKDDFIEIAVNMQHYGIPTRLLDWTSNSLHALYFACVSKENENKDGAVYIVKIESIVELGTDEEKHIANFLEYKYLNSDMRKNDVLTFLDSINSSNEHHYFFKTKYYNDRIRSQKGYFSIYFEQTEAEINEFRNQTLKDFENICNGQQLNMDYVKSLIDKIKLLRFPLSDQSVIDSKVLEILGEFPYNENVKTVLEGEITKVLKILNLKVSRPHDMNKILSKENHIKVLIPTAAKKKLIEQLDDMGINSSTIYPDIEGLSRYLKEKYIN